MRNDLTEIVFILDRSGSMSDLRADTIGGFNSYIEEQRQQPGEAYLTTVLFNDEYKLLYDHVNLQDVQKLTWKDYIPIGSTALMDAVGNTINSIGARLAQTPEKDRPGHVIFVIVTDGYENASKEFNGAKVRQMIEHQQSKYSWQFLFLGAGIDAYKEASSLGIHGMSAMSVSADSVGLKNVYTSISTASTMVRNMATTDSLDDSWKTGDLGAQS